MYKNKFRSLLLKSRLLTNKGTMSPRYSRRGQVLPGPLSVPTGLGGGGGDGGHCRDQGRWRLNHLFNESNIKE